MNYEVESPVNQLANNYTTVQDSSTKEIFSKYRNSDHSSTIPSFQLSRFPIDYSGKIIDNLC